MKMNRNSIYKLGKTVWGVLTIIFFTVSLAAGDVIFKETFDPTAKPEWNFVNGPDGTTNWAVDDDKNHTSEQGADQSANCATQVDNQGTYLPNSNASMTIEIDLADYVNTKLSFWCFYDGELTWDIGQVKINGNKVAPTDTIGYACRDNCPPDWIKEEVDISQYDQQTITLEFLFKSDNLNEGDDDGPWDGFYIDDIEITGDFTETAPDAPVINTAIDPNDGPQDGASDVSLTTGLNWTNPGTGSNTHDVEVLLDVNTNPPTTVVRAFSGSLTDALDSAAIGGPLSGSSTYFWKVTTKNTSTGETASRTWSFKTQCAVVSAFPWIEDFEGDPENDDKWEGTPPQPTHPRCWTVIPDPYAGPQSQPTNYWEQNSLFFNGDDEESATGHSARGPWAGEGGVQWMLTPELNMASGECNLKFALKGAAVAGTDLYVYIGKSSNEADLPESGDNDNFTLLRSYNAGHNMPTDWEDQIIDLADYSGPTSPQSAYKYIAFKLVDDDGWNVYIDDVVVYEFNDRTSTVTEGGGSEPTEIASTVDTAGEAVYVFDVTFNDEGTTDPYPTLIDQIKFTQDTATNEVPDWTNAIAGAKLTGEDGETVGKVNADNILFKGDKFISVGNTSSETYQLKIWLKTDLSAVKDHDKLGFKLRHTDIVTNTSGSSIFITPDPETPVVSAAGVMIQITAAQLKFTTQPHDRAVVDRVVPIAPVVTVQDANGNTDVDYTGTVTLTNTTGLTMADNDVIADKGIVAFDAVKFLQIGGSTALQTNNPDGLTNDTSSVKVMVTGPPVSIWKDDFEGDAKWTYTDEFEIGEPQGKGGSSGNPDPLKAYEGNNVLGTDLSGMGANHGDCEPDLTDDPFTHYTATSEAINCSGKERIALKFYRWLNTQNLDYAYIEVYDGAAWQKVWTTTDADIITENDWSFQEVDISAYADDNANLQIRFGYGPTDSNFFYSGWNIDNIEVVQQPVDTSMNYSFSEAFQQKTSYTVQGTTDQEIIGIKVVTNNDGDPTLNMKGLQFNTQGTTQNEDITKARVYYTADSNVFATTNQFGNDINSISGPFSTTTATQPLLAGVNYFWLVYDIAETAGVDHYVDAKCTQITIDTTNYTPTVTEPAGNRKIISPPELEDVIYILQVLTGYTVSHPFLMTLDYNANAIIDMGDALFVLEYLAEVRDF